MAANIVVSVIMPVHNVGAYVAASIDSVLAQTFRNFELLVIDDGSTDDTAEAAFCPDPRVRLIKQAQAGVSVARNTGLAAAKGRYITFLDGDDLWHPKALQSLIGPLEAEASLSFTHAHFCRFEDGTDRALPLPWTEWQRTGNAYWDMLIDNTLHPGAIAVRAEVVRGLWFDPTLRIGEDRDWFLRLFQRLRPQEIHAVPRTVLYYRQRSASAVRDYKRFLEDEAAVLRRYLYADDVPERIRRRALSAQHFHAAVLLAKMQGKGKEAVRRYLQALLQDPLYLENILRPLRKFWWKCLPPQVQKIPYPAVQHAVGRKPQRISLIVATCGRHDELARLLDSLRAQTHAPYEIIIVDQNPAGFLDDILAQAKDLPIRHVPESRRGASPARNKGLEIATGDIIGFPDDDCLYAPDTLEKVLATFDRYPGWGGLLGTWEPMEQAGRNRTRPLEPPRRLTCRTAFRQSETYVQFFRKQAADTVTGFDEYIGPGAAPYYGSAEDTEYLLRIMRAGFAVGRTQAVRLFHPAVDYASPQLRRKARAYGITRMYLLKKHGFSLPFQLANVMYPLVRLPLECCRHGWKAFPYRWEGFRGRLWGLLHIHTTPIK